MEKIAERRAPPATQQRCCKDVRSRRLRHVVPTPTTRRHMGASTLLAVRSFFVQGKTRPHITAPAPRHAVDAAGEREELNKEGRVGSHVHSSGARARSRSHPRVRCNASRTRRLVGSRSAASLSYSRICTRVKTAWGAPRPASGGHWREIRRQRDFDCVVDAVRANQARDGSDAFVKIGGGAEGDAFERAARDRGPTNRPSTSQHRHRSPPLLTHALQSHGSSETRLSHARERHARAPRAQRATSMSPRFHLHHASRKTTAGHMPTTPWIERPGWT